MWFISLKGLMNLILLSDLRYSLWIPFFNQQGLCNCKPARNSATICHLWSDSIYSGTRNLSRSWPTTTRQRKRKKWTKATNDMHTLQKDQSHWGQLLFQIWFSIRISHQRTSIHHECFPWFLYLSSRALPIPHTRQFKPYLTSSKRGLQPIDGSTSLFQEGHHFYLIIYSCH